MEKGNRTKRGKGEGVERERQNEREGDCEYVIYVNICQANQLFINQDLSSELDTFTNFAQQYQNRATAEKNILAIQTTSMEFANTVILFVVSYTHTHTVLFFCLLARFIRFVCLVHSPFDSPPPLFSICIYSNNMVYTQINILHVYSSHTYRDIREKEKQ